MPFTFNSKKADLINTAVEDWALFKEEIREPSKYEISNLPNLLEKVRAIFRASYPITRIAFSKNVTEETLIYYRSSNGENHLKSTCYLK